MSSSFITRIEREKDEPYTVIFTTDDLGKYRHIEDECRKMIGHAKPTVDAVKVVRCGECKHFNPFRQHDGFCAIDGVLWDNNHFCKCGERRGGDE